MNKKDYEHHIADFYNNVDEVWPSDDKWHMYTHNTISKYVYKKIKSYNLNENQLILNAGSGGMTYNIKHNMYHLDIAETKINKFSDWFTGSVEKLPFEDNFFDVCICVGTVVNYCDVRLAIKELSRVLKPNGKLILEFENSRSIEFLFSKSFSKPKGTIKSKYFNEEHIYWVYSQEYIYHLLSKSGLKVLNSESIHILSSFLYRLIPVENFSYRACYFDKLLQNKKISKYCSNIILEAKKE